MTDKKTGFGAEYNPTKFDHPTLAAIYNYWNEKRGLRKMPPRADIRPSELKEHLGWVIMADVLPGAEEFRYRLIGTLVTQYFLAETTGKTVSEAFARMNDSVRDAVLAVMRVVARDGVPFRASGDANAFAVGFEEFDALFLPLSDDGETVNVILHAFVFDRPDVLMARQIAKSNGGKLVPRAKKDNAA
jgi:hypothetical protein